MERTGNDIDRYSVGEADRESACSRPTRLLLLSLSAPWPRHSLAPFRQPAVVRKEGGGAR